MEQIRKSLPVRRRLFVFSILTVIIMCAIFLFSAQPADDSSSLSEWFLNSPLGQFVITVFPSLSDKGDSYDIRKYAHMFEFMCLGASTFMTVREMLRPYYKRMLFSVFWSWLICLFYACTDEFHQLFVEGRSCQITDVFVDSAGFSLGIALAASALIIIHTTNGRRTVNYGGNT